MFALETWGIRPDEVELLNMQPPQIAAAWERGDIDAAFVWDPALARIKKTGTVMITSGELSAKGKVTFDGVAVMRDFAAANKDFLAKFVRITDDANAAYRDNKAAWTADSPQAKTVAQLFGGDAADVPPSLELYGFLPADVQASSKWFGGGADSAVAKTLKATAEFLKAQGKIDAVLPDYAKYVTAEYVEAAMKLGK
jgi:taurine transport system substrate-binding protein